MRSTSQGGEHRRGATQRSHTPPEDGIRETVPRHVHQEDRTKAPVNASFLIRLVYYRREPPVGSMLRSYIVRPNVSINCFSSRGEARMDCSPVLFCRKISRTVYAANVGHTSVRGQVVHRATQNLPRKPPTSSRAHPQLQNRPVQLQPWPAARGFDTNSRSLPTTSTPPCDGRAGAACWVGRSVAC